MAIDSSTAPYNMYIVDSYHGIQLLDLKTVELTLVLNTTTPRDGVPAMKLVNSLALMSNGSIFFTDSSSKFNRANVLLDIYEAAGNGKLLHYNPKDGGSVSVVRADLGFPNGLCLSPKEDFILVAETTRARIIRSAMNSVRKGWYLNGKEREEGREGESIGWSLSPSPPPLSLSRSIPPFLPPPFSPTLSERRGSYDPRR